MVFIHKGRFDSLPKVTFYLTTVFELHGKTDKCVYSIDRCYGSLAEANDRLAIISRSNANMIVHETLRHGSDFETGCQWVTWTRPGANADKFNFYGEVKQITMNGSVRETDPSDPQAALTAGGITSNIAYRYMYEHKKDLVGHIWAVAIHDPDRKITVAADGRPTSLPWNLESLHEASGNSMARGKRLWKEELKPKVGAFEKFDLHYGDARYLLVPLSAGLKLADDRPDLDAANIPKQRSETGCAQVCIERIEVQKRGSMLAQFVPAQAITFNKPFRPLHPSRKQVPHLPRVESELQALFNDAGEQQTIEEEEEQEQLAGDTVVVPSIYNVYEQWAAGPHTPTPVTRAHAWTSPVPYPPPTPKKRLSSALGAGIPNIDKQLHRNTITKHTKKRLTAPTVDPRGSPIERTRKSIYTNGGVPVLRLDTPGRVALATHGSIFMASRAMRM